MVSRTVKPRHDGWLLYTHTRSLRDLHNGRAQHLESVDQFLYANMGLKNTPILCTIIHPLYTMSLQRVPMQHAPRWITVLPPRPTITMSHICTTTTCCATTSKSTEPTREQQPTRISGEWDGVAITFNSRGEASELPHNVVPDAFREWGVTLVAWQTQCSMMHCEDDTTVQYTLRRLYPTVGCEGRPALLSAR